MNKPTSILLPGLDGTGDLFERFIAAAPSSRSVRVLSLPSDRPRGYMELVDYLVPQLPADRFAIIAESFSGPLAILLANRCPGACAVILCASFVQSPVPRLTSWLPQVVWRIRPSAVALRFLMTGGDRVLANAVRSAVGKLPSEVLAARIAAVLSADVRQDLEHLSQPLLCHRAARDRLVRASSTTTIESLKPSAEFASIDGPHLLLQTMPDECWRRIDPFLQRAFLSSR